jgi:hypothetical protein
MAIVLGTAREVYAAADSMSRSESFGSPRSGLESGVITVLQVWSALKIAFRAGGGNSYNIA